jgi:hypothetical protein
MVRAVEILIGEIKILLSVSSLLSFLKISKAN